MEYLGQSWDVTLPTMDVVKIRETNGDDDARLSTMGTVLSGENVYNFLANIILEPKVTAAEIADWPINNKYYLLFKQRVLNQGPEFVFKHTDPNDKQKRESEYTEDLREIDGNLSDPDYTPNDNQIKKYPHGAKEHVEFTTSSKRRFRFKIMTGILESAALELPQDDNNRNTPLLTRQIEIFKNTQWERLFMFKDISSKEMVELRSQVMKNDPPFSPEVTFTNPFTKNLHRVPLMQIPTFYFPEETT